MSRSSDHTPVPSPALTPAERLDLAQRLYREYHARCFWHSTRDLVIAQELILFVVKGLHTHGSPAS
jgi:hypothetical protein